jgi:hypothetical protein
VTDAGHHRASSHRLEKLAVEFHDKEYRDTYVAAHTRRFLARQMRKFRGDKSQTEFAEMLDKRQTVVSRLENPNYSGWTLGTLFDVASKLNVAVLVRFVDFPTFLKGTADQSESAQHPTEYNQDIVDDFARLEAVQELTLKDIERALAILRQPIAEKDAQVAQAEVMERGLFGPERIENTPWKQGAGAGANINPAALI